MSYSLDARCPCCQAPLQAEILVRCEGHGEHEVGLELAPADTSPKANADAAESCALCESPFADALERQACAERRAQERIAAERGYA